MFGPKTKIVNTTDANGVVWGRKVKTTKVAGMTVTENVGTRFKVSDPNYDSGVLLPESDSPSMVALRTHYADKLAGNPDQGALNAANFAVGLSGASVATGVLYLLVLAVFG